VLVSTPLDVPGDQTAALKAKVPHYWHSSSFFVHDVRVLVHFKFLGFSDLHP
jgi:hypothetical protein